MRIAFTSFARVRPFALVVAVKNLAVFRNIMELPHSYDGKKHVPIPSGKLIIYYYSNFGNVKSFYIVID